MLTWNAPGPGFWELDKSHHRGGTTPLVQHIQTTSMPVAMRRVFADLGTPADTLDCTFVNSFFYTRLRPLIGADKPARKLPPPVVLKVVSRLHPVFRRRTKAAARSLTQRPWRAVIDEWENGGRARVEAANLALQKVVLTELDDATLMQHTREVLEHCCASWEHHFWLHGYDLGPVGLYLTACKRWGVDPSDAIPLLEGASPSSAEPSRIVARIRRAVSAAGAQPSSLDEVRAISPDVAADLDRYLEYRGSVMVSRYDIDGLTLAEMPDVVLATILEGIERTVGEGLQERIDAVRARVPAERRAEFDHHLEEARAAMNLRDDNGPNTAEWPLGLLRIALLEVGRRMVDVGAATQPADALELQPHELTVDTVQGRGPTGQELARRRHQRWELASVDPPMSLGQREPQPPLDVLPKPLAELVTTVLMVIEQTGMGGDRPTTGLAGAGVGTQSYRGRARRADSPEQALERMEPGDVLVVPFTTPAYNSVLALAGGVVTADGGPLSHAAVLARELGIPAVVGAPGALTEIRDGSIVEVDPIAGVVRIVESH